MSSSSSSSHKYNNPNASKPQPRYQKKYIPKSLTPQIPQTLTNSLRASNPTSKSNSNGGGAYNFVNYLPHDEAVASGITADAGAVDAAEAQSVADLLNDLLSRILKLRSRSFWKEVARNDSLGEFLESYLQFRHRWYDMPHHGARGVVAGVIVGENELSRRVFMVLYRMSSNRDPGAPRDDCLSMKEHTALLQEKRLLDLPKLLDICAIYGHDNKELTSSLISNALKAQPMLLDNMSAVIYHFLSIVHTMHDRCNSSLEVLMSSAGSETRGYRQFYKDFLEVMDFLNDAIVTLYSFADAFRHASLYFSTSFEMSYGSDDLLRTLARLHDSLLPCLGKGFELVSCTISNGALNDSDAPQTDAVLGFRLLTTRIVKFGWKLLDVCYLNANTTEDNLHNATLKMIPSKVEDPLIRGEIIVQTLKEIDGEISYNFQTQGGETFLQNIDKEFNILSCIDGHRKSGCIFIDNEQFQYLCQIVRSPNFQSEQKESQLELSTHNKNVQMDEEKAIIESKISQIRDVFPDYGKGFLFACLEAYNLNPEEVIHRILEGSLHEDLLSLDTSLQQIPSTKQPSLSRNDKGKGILVESVPENIPLSSKVGSSMQRNDEGHHPSSHVHGRFTRKTEYDLSDSTVLDSKADKDALRSAVLAVEYEYDDEYDDSFDDLGLSVVESGYEETEHTDRGSLPGAPSGSDSSSRWSSQKKPQFYVKDGKNYSYKVSGSVAVQNAQDAALINGTQRDVIHGLGRGGNFPIGAVRRPVVAMDEVDADDSDDQAADDTDGSGRGNPYPRGRGRGRGGRRGGADHHRKDRAIRKHMQGLTGR